MTLETHPGAIHLLDRALDGKVPVARCGEVADPEGFTLAVGRCTCAACLSWVVGFSDRQTGHDPDPPYGRPRARRSYLKGYKAAELALRAD